jgi:small subunit ribosomal protein S18
MKRYSSRWFRLVEKNRAVNNDYFFKNNIKYIDYKDIDTLSHFINNQGQIVPSIFNKLTLKYQRMVAKAIKRARQMALMPYTIVDQNEWTNNYPQTRQKPQQIKINN